MKDRDKIYNYIQTEINPYGNPFKGTTEEFGLKLMSYIRNFDDQDWWIPVSESIPENDNNVLVMLGHAYNRQDDYWQYSIARIIELDSGKYWYDEHYGYLEHPSYSHSVYKVVAWMPLPERYEGK